MNSIKLALLTFTLCLAACANLNTIGRSTSVPVKSTDAKNGKAIHLDIQQRLVIFDEVGNYCAEPSPDGLAAFAAAMGISASDPTSAAASASGSGGSSAASIGLRTQSITLMRDAMYRVCEASANGNVGPTAVTTLLRRSQDLTAVILAIEQLTGPIAAQQAALYQTTDATGSASLVAVGKQLELAAAQLERAGERLEEVTTRKAALDTELQQTNNKLAELGAKLTATSPAPTAAEVIQLKAEEGTVTLKKQDLERQISALTESIKLRQLTLDKAQETHTLISQKQDSAFASASAGTSGSGAFGTPSPRTILSAEASKDVSGAVKDMVLAVLKQDYLTESCVSLLGINKVTDATLKAQCISLINAEILARSAQTELNAAQNMQETALIKARTFALLPKATLDTVMTCITDSSNNTDTVKLNKLISKANPALKAQHINLFANKTPSQIRGILSMRANLLAPLAIAVENSSVCD